MTTETYPPGQNYVWLIFVLLIAALALVGCAHTPPPEPVKVMVPVPCIAKQPSKPVYPTVTPDAGIYDRVKTVLAEREMRIAYEGELEAALSACD